MAAPQLSNQDLHAPVSNQKYEAVVNEATVETTAKIVVSKELKPDVVTFPEIVTSRAETIQKEKSISKLQKEKSVSAVIDDAAIASFGNQRLEIVFDNDDREQVKNVLDIPWRKIAALRINARDGRTYVGTGWFINRRVVVTAGHCVYLHDAGGWPNEIEVIPALDGENRPFGSHITSVFKSNNGWVNDRNSDFDYGVIILNELVDARVGAFSFAAPNDEVLNATIANVSGYPFDRDRAVHQFYHARKINRSSSRRLYYEIDTYGGQSGCPVWMNLGENERVAVGIHTTGSTASNFATRITEELFNNLKNWKNEHQ